MFNRLAQATKQYIARGKTESPVGKIIQEAQTMTAAVQNPIPPSEKLLFTFKTESDLARWSTFTDQEFGGQSEALLALSPTPPVRGTAFIPSQQQHICTLHVQAQQLLSIHMQSSFVVLAVQSSVTSVRHSTLHASSLHMTISGVTTL